MSDIPNGIPLPRANPRLVGHAHAEERLVGAWASGRLPHGWLISGPRGIGKATLAYRFARFLLAHGSPSAPADDGPSMFGDALPPAVPTSLAIDEGHPVFRRIAAGAHADLRVIERGPAPEDRNKEPDRQRIQTVIPVDAIRAAGHGMGLTAGEGGWRVIIVDGAEDMNPNAANALLKVLEEPPPRALLMLVTHAPGRLLPTIRSRCCQLRLAPLGSDSVSELLRTFRADLGEQERRALAGLADGSIGRALSLADSDGLSIKRDLIGLLSGLPDLDTMTAHKFADRFTRREADAAWRTAVDLTTRCVADLVASSARGTSPESRGYAPDEAACLIRLQGMASLDRWVEVWEKTSRLFAQADSASLDRKQVMLSALGTMESAARSGV
ncbi:MAG: DNA polymerase III subunit delta' [Rhodospirillaceae bacterium]